jgi:hypothetical protein
VLKITSRCIKFHLELGKKTPWAVHQSGCKKRRRKYNELQKLQPEVGEKLLFLVTILQPELKKNRVERYIWKITSWDKNWLVVTRKRDELDENNCCSVECANREVLPLALKSYKPCPNRSDLVPRVAQAAGDWRRWRMWWPPADLAVVVQIRCKEAGRRVVAGGGQGTGARRASWDPHRLHLARAWRRSCAGTGRRRLGRRPGRRGIHTTAAWNWTKLMMGITMTAREEDQYVGNYWVTAWLRAQLAGHARGFPTHPSLHINR